MAFALGRAGQRQIFLVVLNDNKNINTNGGRLLTYLGRLRTDPKYSRIKAELESFFKQIPVLGKRMVDSAERLKRSLKYLLVPGMLFEELGFTYLGPVDGHNIIAMKDVFWRAARIKGPVLVHVLLKGKRVCLCRKGPGPFPWNRPFQYE